MAYNILPRLYLGDRNDAIRDDVPNKYDVVINCTPDIPFHPELVESQRIRLNLIDIPDISENNKMYDLIKPTIETIDDILHTSKTMNILVHCYMGRQRSAAIVAAYIMYRYNTTANEAIIFIKNKKPDAFFGSVTFINALFRWQTEIQKPLGNAA